VLISSLSPSAPFTFLNLSLGDCATIERRACGCPLDAEGFAWHLHGIRSYEKLTAGGMTFLDADVVGILDETLPRRFGGGPTDYQLVEEEDEAGRPGLRLVVNPAIGPLEDAAVIDTFLDTLGRGSGVERVMALQWRASAFVRVERRRPYPSPSGKILHLHRSTTPPVPGLR
jgi:hypothetical protein